MGRYLDLLRDPNDSENARSGCRDISDKSDQSHASVDGVAETRGLRGVRSLLSLMSHAAPAEIQATTPEADPTEAAIPPVNTWSDAEEERAAVVEYDGGIPRDWAEGFVRLHPDRPTGDVPSKRWQRFVDDVGRFLDSPFCGVAAAFGWGPYDLFGADRDQPFARIDQAGLLWLLNGNKLVALTENTATIETRTGARQTYRRKPNEPGRVLVWELK